MQVKILSEKENEVLHRKELKIGVGFDGPTISKQKLTEELANHLKIDASTIEITKFDNHAGERAGTAHVKVWKNAEMREKLALHKRKKVEAKPEEKK